MGESTEGEDKRSLNNTGSSDTGGGTGRSYRERVTVGLSDSVLGMAHMGKGEIPASGFVGRGGDNACGSAKGGTGRGGGENARGSSGIL